MVKHSNHYGVVHDCWKHNQTKHRLFFTGVIQKALDCISEWNILFFRFTQQCHCSCHCSHVLWFRKYKSIFLKIFEGKCLIWSQELHEIKVSKYLRNRQEFLEEFLSIYGSNSSHRGPFTSARSSPNFFNPVAWIVAWELQKCETFHPPKFEHLSRLNTVWLNKTSIFGDS